MVMPTGDTEVFVQESSKVVEQSNIVIYLKDVYSVSFYVVQCLIANT